MSNIRSFTPVIQGFCLLFLLCFSQASLLFANQSAVESLSGHGGPVNTVAVSPDGKSLLSGSLDYAVMLWDLTAQPVQMKRRFIAHEGAVSAVSWFSDSARALSAGDDGRLYLWDTAAAKLLQTSTDRHQGKTVAISVANDASLAVTAGWDGTVRIWDLPALTTRHILQVHKEMVSAALISADQRVVYSGGYDGRIRAWDAESGELIDVLHESGWPINLMRWLPDQQRMVFGSSNGAVQVFDTRSNKISKVLMPHEKPVLGLAVSATHDLLATGGNDGMIRVWDMQDWSLSGQKQGIRGPVWALTFAGDGKSLFYGSLDDDVKVWLIAMNNEAAAEEGAANTDQKIRRFQVTEGKSLGEVQFARKCSVCHTLKPGDANRAGPSLYQVFGRKAGTLAGYPYSESLLNSDLIWNEETIDALFADGPHIVVPDSKMPLQKMPDDKKRGALIEYLREVTR